MPRQVSYLKSKANALLLAGQNDSAAVVQQSILQIDSLDFDANLFLGSYYAGKGEERLDSIDERYLETLGQSTRPALLYREEKREVLATDIARARHYFTVATGIRNNRYLADQLARLESLTDELPQSGGTAIPLLNRLKQE